MPHSKKLLPYFILPLVAEFLLIGGYFHGPSWVAEMIAPSFNREFGLLELTQAGLIVAIAILALRAGLAQTSRWARWAWCGLAMFSTLVFLEEIDYGLHVYELITAVPPAERATVRNIHNQGTILGTLKQVVDTAYLAFFLVLPWFASRVPDRVRFLVPDRHTTLTLLVAGVVSSTAHWIEDRQGNTEHALYWNVAEFRELLTYWIAFLYVHTVKERIAIGSSDEPPRTAMGPHPA